MSRLRDRTADYLTILIASCAAGIGLLSAVGPGLAVAAFLALIAVPTVVLRPKIMPHILVVATFAQYVSFHGVTVQRLVTPLAVIAIVTHIVNEPARSRRPTVTLRWVTAYSALALASVAWTVSSSGTFKALASLAIALTFMAAFILLVRDSEDLRALLRTVTAGSVVLATWWIVSLIRGVDRAANPAGDPNFNAMLMAMAIPLVLALAISARTSGHRVALLALITILAGAIVATLSRGGLVALLATTLSVALLPTQTLFRSRSQRFVSFLAVVLGLMVLLALAWSSLSARFEEGFTQANKGSGRGDLWLAAIYSYRHNPITGIGYGAFSATSQELLATTPGVNLQNFLHFSRLQGQEAHNAYLGSLTELGPLGLVFFLGILFATARSLLRSARRASLAGDPFLCSVGNALAISLLAFSVSSFFLSTETSGRGLWMIIGLSVALPTILREELSTGFRHAFPKALGGARPERHPRIERGAILRRGLHP